MKPVRDLLANIKRDRRSAVIAAATVLVFGAIGVVALQSSNAATGVALLEAESGSTGGNADKLSNIAGAGGQSTVRFKAGSTTPPTTPPPSGSMPPITVSGNKIMRGGQPWWFVGTNSFVWSGNCGNDDEKMSVADVEAWFAGMRHDGHAAVRLFFYDGWDNSRLDAAVASAKKHNVYLTITLDDAIGGCGENDKDAAWFNNSGERAVFKAHMEEMLNRYKGETAFAWFEYFNEPSYEGGKLRQFYDEMGAAAANVDPSRLFASGTVAAYWLDGESNFKDVASSPGVDISSMHEYDEGEVESNHGPGVRANSAGKPVIVGEFGIKAGGCMSFSERANKYRAKLKVYTNTSIGYAGGLAWAWQPGGGGAGGCELGNIDVDTPTQDMLRTFTP